MTPNFHKLVIASMQRREYQFDDLEVAFEQRVVFEAAFEPKR